MLHGLQRQSWFNYKGECTEAYGALSSQPEKQMSPNLKFIKQARKQRNIETRLGNKTADTETREHTDKIHK